MSSNPPSKHHYIPEFYLKRWGGLDHRMVRYTKPAFGKIMEERRFPSEIGFQTDLYRAPLDDLTAAQALESHFFAKLDNMAAEALANLLDFESRTLKRESIEVWCIFVLALLHRTPHSFDALISSGINIFKMSVLEMEDRYAAIRGPNDPSSFQEFVETRDEIEGMRRTFRIVPDLILNSNILEFLRKMHWAVLVLQNPCPNLLLSDDPLIRTDGLRNDGGHVALPLSPNHLMIGAWQEETLMYLKSCDAKYLVKQVNQQTVESARIFVVATDVRQRRFIENRFGAKPRPALLSIQ